MNRRYLLFLAVSTFILTVLWVASNVFHGIATSTIDPLLQTQIQPIPPDFDSDALNGLRKRTIVQPLFNSVPAPVVEGEETDQPTTAGEGTDDTSSVSEPQLLSPSPSPASEIPTPTQELLPVDSEGGTTP